MSKWGVPGHLQRTPISAAISLPQSQKFSKAHRGATCLKMYLIRGTRWLSCWASAFGSGHDSRGPGIEPHIGLLTQWDAWFLPFPLLVFPLSLCVSLSKINKIFKKFVFGITRQSEVVPDARRSGFGVELPFLQHGSLYPRPHF